eukprot:Skav216712  [mRNA]  locus=scaffold91:670704:674960:- [translate_table: standard]
MLGNGNHVKNPNLRGKALHWLQSVTVVNLETGSAKSQAPEMTSRPQHSGAVALWHCCACGREWRAEHLGDDTECCPFAPKMLAFGAKSAWGQHNVDQCLSDEESDVPVVDLLTKASSSAKAKLSTESTAPGSRSSCSQQPGSPGSC